MSLVEGVRENEKRQRALFVGVEARMLQVHCGDEGAQASRELREQAVADADADVYDDCDDLDLDPSSPLAAEIIDARERREAADWWREQGGGDGGDGDAIEEGDDA